MGVRAQLCCAQMTKGSLMRYRTSRTFVLKQIVYIHPFCVLEILFGRILALVDQVFLVNVVPFCLVNVLVERLAFFLQSTLQVPYQLGPDVPLVILRVSFAGHLGHLVRTHFGVVVCTVMVIVVSWL